MEEVKAPPLSADQRAGIEQSLERILQRPEFASSPRQQAFLRFVIDETLNGRANRLKAFTIATTVFGRNEDFDPQTNSIVRVEALRLRRLLEQYYAGAGAGERFEIHIPRGTYVPQFIERPDPTSTPDVAAIAPALDTPPAPAASRLSNRRTVWSLRVALATALVCLVGFSVSRFVIPHPPAMPIVAFKGPIARTTIAVGAIDADVSVGPVARIAKDLSRQIEDTLNLFDNLTVVRDDPAIRKADYRLSGMITSATDHTLALSFRILNARTNEIIWSRRFDAVPFDAVGTNSGQVISLVSDVAQSYGAIFADRRQRLAQQGDQISGLDCVILAYDVFDTPSDARYQRARACLEKSIALDPTFASGYAALSYLDVANWLGDAGVRSDASLDQALARARDAVRLAPYKGRVHAAYFWARFFDRRFDDAFDSAKTALELNPYAADTLARVGAAHILQGRNDEGMTFLRRGAHANILVPGWQEFFLFLGAHLSGDDERAQRHALRRSTASFALGQVARIIVAHERGKPDAVKKWRSRLAADFPAFAADIPRALTRWAMAPAVRDRLLADLDAAGGSLNSAFDH